MPMKYPPVVTSGTVNVIEATAPRSLPPSMAIGPRWMAPSGILGGSIHVPDGSRYACQGPFSIRPVPLTSVENVARPVTLSPTRT